MCKISIFPLKITRECIYENMIITLFSNVLSSATLSNNFVKDNRKRKIFYTNF